MAYRQSHNHSHKQNATVGRPIAMSSEGQRLSDNDIDIDAHTLRAFGAHEQTPQPAESKRRRLVDSALATYGPHLTPITNEGHRYLIARTETGEGVYLIANRRGVVSDFTEQVYEACVAEAAHAGLAMVFHVHSRYNLYATGGVHWTQTPSSDDDFTIEELRDLARVAGYWSAERSFREDLSAEEQQLAKRAFELYGEAIW